MEHKARDAERLLGGEKIPQELVDVLQHIILSHHGEVSLGFGSSKSPATPEAIAVHYIENMDAKLMMSLAACRGEESGSAMAAPGDGKWTEYMKAFQGRLYRPDVAPADAPLAQVEAPDLGSAAASVPAAASHNGAAAAADSAAVRLSVTNPLFEAAPAKHR